MVELLAVLLLAHPLDCFSAAKHDQKARDCCAKGDCKPSNSDDCCKATVQGGDELLAGKTAAHPVPLVVVATVALRAVVLPWTGQRAGRQDFAPESPPGVWMNLPLLI